MKIQEYRYDDIYGNLNKLPDSYWIIRKNKYITKIHSKDVSNSSKIFNFHIDNYRKYSKHIFSNLKKHKRRYIIKISGYRHKKSVTGENPSIWTSLNWFQYIWFLILTDGFSVFIKTIMLLIGFIGGLLTIIYTFFKIMEFLL